MPVLMIITCVIMKLVVEITLCYIQMQNFRETLLPRLSLTSPDDFRQNFFLAISLIEAFSAGM